MKLPIYLLIDIRTLSNLSLDLGSDQKNEIMDLSDGISFPFHGVCGLILGDTVRNSDACKGLRVEPLLLRAERSQVMWSRKPSLGVILNMGDPRADPKHTTEDTHSSQHLRTPQ